MDHKLLVMRSNDGTITGVGLRSGTGIFLAIAITLMFAAQADDKPFAGQQLDQQRAIFEKKFKAAKDKLFLFFDPKENGVDFPNQVIDFDLTLGQVLQFGPYKVPAESVRVFMSDETVYQDSLALKGDAQDWKKKSVLSFSWPLSYVFSGELQIRDDANSIKWQKKISNEDVWLWLHHVESRISDPKFKLSRTKSLQENAFIEDRELNANLSNESANIKISPKHWTSAYGFVGREIDAIPDGVLKNPFRICLIKDGRSETEKKETGEAALLTVCSQRYRMVDRSGTRTVQASGRIYEPEITINNQKTTLKGRTFFAAEGLPVQFSALLKDGTYFEFLSAPKPVNIIDIVTDETTGRIEIVGFGNPPVGEVEMVKRDNRSFWDFLNFMPTIGDFRDFWRIQLPPERPYLYLRGDGGFPFRQELYFKSLPGKQDRVYLLPQSKQSTYKEEILLKGVRTSSRTRVSSRQRFAKNTRLNGFDWNLRAPKSGDYNHANLLLKTPRADRPWRAYYEVYRGYPGELSVRATGVVGSDLSVLILGEAAAQYWFEDLLGWENKWASVQRWGLAARTFMSLASLNVPNGSEVVDFAVTNADIKYRLSPGVWGRDPSVGLIAGYQNVTLAGFNVQMLGGGAFWARSMPKIFDRIFNIIPFMRYPKWVDMELLWYPLSLNPDQKIDFTFALNFHGKVQWSKQWFGEAGFGLKNFTWADLAKERSIGFGLAYSTIGLGYQF